MIKQRKIVPGEIIEFIIEGDSSVEEILGVIQNHYGSISKSVIWNLSAGSNSRLTSADMVLIAKTVKKYAVHTRAAYVCPVDLEFGLFRMYQSYAEMQGVTTGMKVFRSRDEALLWLKVKKDSPMEVVSEGIPLTRRCC